MRPYRFTNDRPYFCFYSRCVHCNKLGHSWLRSFNDLRFWPQTPTNLSQHFVDIWMLINFQIKAIRPFAFSRGKSFCCFVLLLRAVEMVRFSSPESDPKVCLPNNASTRQTRAVYELSGESPVGFTEIHRDWQVGGFGNLRSV